MARNAARSGRKVLFFSLEIDRAHLSQRLIALGSGVQDERLQAARLDGADWEKIMLTMGEVSELPIWVCDRAELSPQDIRSYLAQFIEQAREEPALDLVVIDGLNLVGTEGNSQRAYALQHTQGVVRELKVMARALNLPVLLTCQVSPKADARINHVPQLADLQLSGGIEDYADVICLLYREELHDPYTELKGLADIIVAKNRHGPEGQATLYYHPSIYRFRDLEHTPSEQQ